MENINKFLKNNFQKIVTVIIVTILVAVVSFFSQNNNISKTIKTENINYVKIAGKMIKVELVTTLEEQERGLSGRDSLKKDKGMLFIFNQANKYSFWMKDMNFPIDIIWIGENFQVISIKKNASPDSYPETFSPNQDAKYVLEVISSFSEKNNLREGDKVEFLSS